MRFSAACWTRFGAVLAREFGEPAYFALHQLTVDAYAVQHPGGARACGHPAFVWLDPPSMDGRLTVAGVVGATSPSEHERRVRAWATDAWEAWGPHHDTVRRWLLHSLV